MGFKQDRDRVTLEMSEEDYEQLIRMFGYATSAALARKGVKVLDSYLAFMDRINEGNPKWTSYRATALKGKTKPK